MHLGADKPMEANIICGCVVRVEDSCFDECAKETVFVFGGGGKAVFDGGKDVKRSGFAVEVRHDV